jgi:hypothetical protein
MNEQKKDEEENDEEKKIENDEEENDGWVSSLTAVLKNKGLAEFLIIYFIISIIYVFLYIVITIIIVLYRFVQHGNNDTQNTLEYFTSQPKQVLFWLFYVLFIFFLMSAELLMVLFLILYIIYCIFRSMGLKQMIMSIEIIQQSECKGVFPLFDKVSETAASNKSSGDKTKEITDSTWKFTSSFLNSVFGIFIPGAKFDPDYV